METTDPSQADEPDDENAPMNSHGIPQAARGDALGSASPVLGTKNFVALSMQ